MTYIAFAVLIQTIAVVMLAVNRLYRTGTSKQVATVPVPKHHTCSGCGTPSTVRVKGSVLVNCSTGETHHGTYWYCPCGRMDPAPYPHYA